MNFDLKQKFKSLWPYLFALGLVIALLIPNLFLDFRADDYHFFRLYSGSELSYVWTHNYDFDNIENDGLRPIWMLVFHIVTLIGGFNYAWVGFVTLLVVAIKVVLTVKLSSYFIKNKALMLAAVFLAATSYSQVSHHYMATEIPANVCIILILSSLILLFGITQSRRKRAAFAGSLFLMFLAAFTKEIAVPFLLFPPVMYIYLSRNDDSFGFRNIKSTILFIAACGLPVFYLIWRLTFFVSNEYQVSLMTHVHYAVLGAGYLFNILYDYSFRHNLWRPGVPILALASLIITYLFDLLILLIGILAFKNFKGVFRDKLNLLLLLLIFFSFVVLPVNGGGRLNYLYIAFSFILIGRILETFVVNVKWKNFFLAASLVMIATNIYITFSYISDMMTPFCPYVVDEDRRLLDNINRTDGYQNNAYLLRDEYKVQLDYLKARIEKEKSLNTR